MKIWVNSKTTISKWQSLILNTPLSNYAWKFPSQGRNNYMCPRLSSRANLKSPWFLMSIKREKDLKNKIRQVHLRELRCLKSFNLTLKDIWFLPRGLIRILLYLHILVLGTYLLIVLIIPIRAILLQKFLMSQDTNLRWTLIIGRLRR